jgi:hypothetical protein
MPLNPDRTPVRPLRGPYTSLLAVLQDLEEGELVWAEDQRRHLIVLTDEFGDNSFLSTLDVDGAVTIALTGIGAVQIGGTLSAPEISVDNATITEAGLLSAADKVKLNGLSALVPATTSVLGGVKSDGATVSIAGDGTLSVVGGGGMVPTSREVIAGTALSGGGALTADVTLNAVIATNPEATTGTANNVLMTPLRVAEAVTSRIVNGLSSTSTTQALSAAAGKTLNDGKADKSVVITAGTGLTGGGDLSAARSLAADIASEADALAGTNNTRLMTALRTQQLVSTLGGTPTSRVIASGTGLTGGGNLTADRTLALTGQALQLHNLTGEGLLVRADVGGYLLRELAGSGGITVTNPRGTAGNPTVAPTVATNGQAIAGTANDVLMTPLRVAEAIAALASGAAVSVDTFNASGTFTKSADDLFYWVEIVGAAGSGAKSGTLIQTASGGGGGGHARRLLLASTVTSTVAVTVGNGGAAITGGNTDGLPGETTSFGPYLAVFGGRGGEATSGSPRLGGSELDPAFAVNIDPIDGYQLIFGGGYGGTGGGGGGESVYGGGGGAASVGSPNNAGGVSTYAGNGGNGGTTSSGSGGTIPGGGGGATQTGAASGAGARGRVTVVRVRRRA